MLTHHEANAIPKFEALTSEVQLQIFGFTFRSVWLIASEISGNIMDPSNGTTAEPKEQVQAITDGFSE